jgi:hypothetical protein
LILRVYHRLIPNAQTIHPIHLSLYDKPLRVFLYIYQNVLWYVSLTLICIIPFVNVSTTFVITIRIIISTIRSNKINNWFWIAHIVLSKINYTCFSNFILRLKTLLNFLFIKWKVLYRQNLILVYCVLMILVIT